jgi:hypothetical protein
MAKILDVYRINGSFEMAKIAGIESTAKSRSVNSITATTIIEVLPFFSIFNGKEFANVLFTDIKKNLQLIWHLWCHYNLDHHLHPWLTMI